MPTLLLVYSQNRKRHLWQGATDDRVEAMKQFWFENLGNFEGQTTPEASHFIRVETDGTTSFQPLPADWRN